MDYGRGIINWQNQVEGRPFARGGTGCACGIMGTGESYLEWIQQGAKRAESAMSAKAAVRLLQGVNLPLAQVASMSNAHVTGPIEGMGPGAGFVEANAPGGAAGSAALGMLGAYAQVMPVSRPDGSPLAAADVVWPMEAAAKRMAGTARIVEEQRFEVFRIGNVEYSSVMNDKLQYPDPAQRQRVAEKSKMAAMKRAYELGIGTLKLQQAYLLDDLFELQAYVRALSLMTDSAKLGYNAQMQETADNLKYASGIIELIPGFIETNSSGAASIDLRSTYERLRDGVRSVLAFFAKVGVVAQKVVNLVDEATDVASQQLKNVQAASGAFGAIAVGVIGLIAVLMLSGRKK